jgi:hypothetical protein
MADWSQAARLPEFAARVHGWGFRDVRLRQLASGGQEVCLVALRRKELRRLDRKRKPRRRGEPASAGGQRRTDPPQSTLSGPHF